jgi:hypothetical protein
MSGARSKLCGPGCSAGSRHVSWSPSSVSWVHTSSVIMWHRWGDQVAHQVRSPSSEATVEATWLLSCPAASSQATDCWMRPVRFGRAARIVACSSVSAARSPQGAGRGRAHVDLCAASTVTTV